MWSLVYKSEKMVNSKLLVAKKKIALIPSRNWGGNAPATVKTATLSFDETATEIWGVPAKKKISLRFLMSGIMITYYRFTKRNTLFLLPIYNQFSENQG